MLMLSTLNLKRGVSTLMRKVLTHRLLFELLFLDEDELNSKFQMKNEHTVGASSVPRG